MSAYVEEMELFGKDPRAPQEAELIRIVVADQNELQAEIQEAERLMDLLGMGTPGKSLDYRYSEFLMKPTCKRTKSPPMIERKWDSTESYYFAMHEDFDRIARCDPELALVEKIAVVVRRLL